MTPIRSESARWQQQPECNYHINKFYDRSRSPFDQSELVAMRSRERMQQQQMIRSLNRRNYTGPSNACPNSGSKLLNNNRYGKVLLYKHYVF